MRVSMSDRDLYAPAKGPQDSHWLRTYRSIGLRKDNWRLYSCSSEHHQCPDCGYYWPTEGVNGFATQERMGRCWQCWMHAARPDELALIKRQASALGNAVKTEEPRTGSLRKL